jgi:hypothetical protein
LLVAGVLPFQVLLGLRGGSGQPLMIHSFHVATTATMVDDFAY